MNTFAVVVFAVWCACLAAIDLRELRLPNELTIAGAGVILAYGWLAGAGRAVTVGAGLLAGVYALVHLLAPTSLGAGDVKFAVGLGGAAGMAGAHAWVVAAFLAPVLTATFGLLLRRQRPVPHGPAMGAATVCALLISG